VEPRASIPVSAKHGGPIHVIDKSHYAAISLLAERFFSAPPISAQPRKQKMSNGYSSGSLRYFAWEFQRALIASARRIGIVVAANSNNIFRAATVTFSVFLIVFPVLAVVFFYLTEQILLVSFPLLLMFISGLFGFRLAMQICRRHW
jgi:hypothetical protein